MTTSNYTTLLGLALPTTGDLSGQWGNEVNSYITEFLDTAVAGSLTITGDVTLTKTTGTSLGATSSQYAVLITSGLSANTTVTAPAASKVYIVNNTSSLYTLKIRGAGPTTGVTLAASEKAVVAWNGSDFVKIVSSATDGVSTISFGTTGLTPSTATDGAVTVAGTLVAANGGTGQSSYTTGDLLYATGSTALSKLGIGTNGQILTSTGTAPQWSTLSGVAVTTFSAGTTGFTPSSATSGAITLAGTLATTNGGTGLTSFTANGVVYASSTSALTTGSALSFNGTSLTIGSGSGSPFARINGGTAAGLGGGYAIDRNGTEIGGVYSGSWYTSGSAAVNTVALGTTTAEALLFGINYAEQMRLTSTGLGIGTSSPSFKLDVAGANAQSIRVTSTNGDLANLVMNSTGNASWSLSSDTVMRFKKDSTEYMRLDSSGNLGLGVTPSASWANYKVLQIGEQGVISGFASGAGVLNIGANFYWDGSGYRYLTTNAASLYQQNAGAHNWRIAASSTAGNAISFTQAMTLDASGNLVVGATSTSYRMEVVAPSGDNITALFRSGDATAANNAGGGFRSISSATAASRIAQLWLDADGANLSGGDYFYIQKNGNSGTADIVQYSNAAMTFATNATERARITSTGTFQLTNNYQEGVLTANTGTAYTIDLVNGTLQILTLTGNCTFTFPTATAGQSFTMLLRQDGTGGRTVTWPAAVRWPGNTAPTITSTASQTDKYIFTSDGTRWYGSNAGQAYVA